MTELVQRFNATLERAFPQVIFEAEISQVKRAASGHFYLALKDEKSQVAAVIWQGTARSIQFELKPGLAVVCHGRPNIWNVSGALQVVISRIELAGEGLLQKKFLEMKARLEKEGLFAVERKRELPFFPRAVGVVTSSTGAVIHDIMVKIQERMPSLQVYLVDARVQGEGAAQEIADGVNRLAASGLVDVIIVARGGGSLEDLWPFNEEVVVRAIFASRVPVVSGVGHEVDYTLSDFVADVRAPTPTAAAEMVVPLRSDLLSQIAELERRLLDYERWLLPRAQRVDELALRLEHRSRLVLENCSRMVLTAEARLRSVAPERVVAALGARLDLLRERLAGAMKRRLAADEARLEKGKLLVVNAMQRFLTVQRHRFERVAAQSAAVDPRAVMKRGYSVVESGGRVVRRASDLEVDDRLQIIFSEGDAEARVTRRS